MKKLLYITTNINDSGGVSKLLSVKLNHLVQKFRYNVYVINTAGNTNSLFYEFDKRIVFQFLDKERSNLLSVLKYRKKLNNAISKIEPDIIINCDNGLKGAFLPFLIGNNIPLVYENHNGRDAKGETLKFNLKLKLSFSILSLSANKYYAIIVYPYDLQNWKTNNIKAISNPLWFEKPEIGASLSNKVAIAVGRLSYQKGYDKLIKIWSIVIKKHPDWILNIYGEGNTNDLKELSQKLNISNKVQFLEPVTDIKSIYLNASMLLNTSRFEPFGLALIEAIACGLPVIAFKNNQGPKSYIDDNENGFLIEKDDLKDYANKIILLIENEKEMKRISNNARESVKAYNLNTIMKLWDDLFKSIK